MLIQVNPLHPEPRKIQRAVDALMAGEVIGYPTDTVYGLGCDISSKKAADRLYQIKGMDRAHPLAFLCPDLSEIAKYAVVDDAGFRFLKTPGSYTFILRARRELPRRLLHERRKTIGVRLPGHAVAQALLDELGEPMLSATLSLPGEVLPLSDPGEIRDRLEHQLDLVIDGGHCGTQPSTIIDLTGAAPSVVREGKGSLAPFAAEPV
jgi:tRNA threonylcarbamoyl adenosine modification protein (Sua5/YciO/YrdC/YwlC family)